MSEFDLRKYKGVIFDMDGTIADTEMMHFDAYQRVVSRYGVKLNYETAVKEFGGRGSEWFFTNFFRSHGIEGDVGGACKEKEEIFFELLEERGVGFIDGFSGFLEEVKGRGMPRAVASGSGLDVIHAVLGRLGVLGEFGFLLSSKGLCPAKPAPDLFLIAAERLGLSREEVVVIEDSMLGVEAAKAAGMDCVGLLTTTEKEALVKAGADWLVRDYGEL